MQLMLPIVYQNGLSVTLFTVADNIGTSISIDLLKAWKYVNLLVKMANTVYYII
jgi:hypothetical protein